MKDKSVVIGIRGDTQYTVMYAARIQEDEHYKSVVILRQLKSYRVYAVTLYDLLPFIDGGLF